MSILEKRPKRLRVASYNIHKCRGLDGRVRPGRIADVLAELDADIVALQEVVGPGNGREEDHARRVAEGLGYHSVFGQNRIHHGAAYGNFVMSRFPVLNSWNYNITTWGREPRGVLRADVKVANGPILHLFNVHLGTAYRERCEQARHLVSERILRNPELAGARLLLGDFNEWFPGLASRLLTSHFENPNFGAHPARHRSYPGILPFFRLDHIYFDGGLKLDRLACHRSLKARVASDHLPIVADFNLQVHHGSLHNPNPCRRHGSLELQPEQHTALLPA
jgi:endonuclease/exonuclease/phosphatase family metal-dependent hydrolase